MLNAIQIHVFCFNIASENYAPHKCILKDFMSKGREHSFAKASSYFSVDKTSSTISLQLRLADVDNFIYFPYFPILSYDLCIRSPIYHFLGLPR
jgi:hypothetical protein